MNYSKGMRGECLWERTNERRPLKLISWLSQSFLMNVREWVVVVLWVYVFPPRLMKWHYKVFFRLKSRRPRLLLSRLSHLSWLHHPKKMTELGRKVVRRMKGFHRVHRRRFHHCRHHQSDHLSHHLSCRQTMSPKTLLNLQEHRCSTSRTSEWWLRSWAWWCQKLKLGSLESVAVFQCCAACSSRCFPCPIDQSNLF